MVLIALTFTYSGDTLTIKPSRKGEKLPVFSKLSIDKGITYGITTFGRFELGMIPEGFKLDRMNRYNEMVFKNASLKPKKRHVHPLLKSKRNEQITIF